MAFNPFHSFRKYSKTMFAILAIICMFTFVLSSGIGGGSDFFDQIGRFFGGDGNSPKVAVIDGDNITHRELQEVMLKRRIANEYMTLATGHAYSRVIGRAMDARDMDQFTKQHVTSIVIDFMGGFQNAQRMGMTQSQAIQQHIATLEPIIERARAEKKTAAADAVESLKRLFQHMLTRSAVRQQGELYFGGTLRSGEGLIDFMAWKWLADKRDIRLTDETVRDLIEYETLGELTAEDARNVQDRVLRNRQITDKMLLEAFADEFRVWIAQTMAMGISMTRADVPSFVTPYELRQDYTDKRTVVRFSLLPLAVDQYVAKVTDKPSESELKALYNKFKNSEWNPASEDPGFKDPKRIKLAYISGRANLEAFKKAGQEQAKQDNLATATLPFAISVPPVGGVAMPLGGVLASLHKVPELPNTRLKEEYEKYTSRDRIVPWAEDQFYGFRLHESSVVHPHVYASVVASAFGAYGGRGSPLAPATTLYAQSAVQEARERIRIGMSAFAGVGPSPWTLSSLPTAAVTPPLSLEVVRPQLSQEINDNLTRDAFEREMRKFHDELTKRSKEISEAKKKPAKKDDVAKKPEPKKDDAKKPDNKKDETAKKPDAKDTDPKKALEEYIAGFVKKFGLSTGASKELRDRYALVNDAGVKTLSDLYFKERRKNDPQGYEFAPQLFQGSFSSTGAPELYAPNWFDGESYWFSPGPTSFRPIDQEMFVVWKTEETEAKVLPFEQARPEVEKAWKLAKARDLAKAAAEEIVKKFQKRVEEKKLKDLAAIEAELKDFAAEEKLTPIKLEPLPRVASHMLMPTAGPTYMDGRVSQEQVPYAGPDFSRKLTDMRKKPPGETVVLFDMPKSRYYVGILLGADPGSDYDFRSAFGRISPRSDESDDMLLLGYGIEQRRKFQEELVKQLRADAKVQVFTEELKRFDEHGSADSE